MIRDSSGGAEILDDFESLRNRCVLILSKIDFDAPPMFNAPLRGADGTSEIAAVARETIVGLPV